MFAVFSNARVIKQIFIKKLIGSNGTGVYIFKKYSPGGSRNDFRYSEDKNKKFDIKRHFYLHTFDYF